jgi:hypothetical protein
MRVDRRLRLMAKTDPRIDAYIAKSQDFAKPILRELRARVHEHVPGVEEDIKWGFPSFIYKGGEIAGVEIREALTLLLAIRFY